MILDYPIIAYDLETTSEKPQSCRVCQIAGIRIERDPSRDDLPLFTAIADEICDPGLASSDAATAIHGIGPEQWAGKRPDHEALSAFYDHLHDNYLSDGAPQFVVAGHNVKWFDLPILWRITERPELRGLPVIDTMQCAQRVYPGAPSHRLTTNPKEPEKTGLIEWLELGPVEGAHSVAGDAMMVYRLVHHFCAGLNKTPLELAAWCAEPRLLKYCGFGKHKGKLWGRFDANNPHHKGLSPDSFVPSGYAAFIARDFDPSPDLEATIWYHYKMRFAKRAR